MGFEGYQCHQTGLAPLLEVEGGQGAIERSTLSSLLCQYILEIDITCWDADPVPEEEEGFEGGD